MEPNATPGFFNTDKTNDAQRSVDDLNRRLMIQVAAVYVINEKAGASQFVDLVDMLGLDEELLSELKRLRRSDLVEVVNELRFESTQKAAASDADA